MNKAQLIQRTKTFAVNIIRLANTMPQSRSADIIGRQIIRSATSVGANYRSSCRAKSTDDFIAKIQIVEEEADESLYWLEIIKDLNLVPEEKLQPLVKEADELVAIFTSSGRTAKENRAQEKSTYRSIRDSDPVVYDVDSTS